MSIYCTLNVPCAFLRQVSEVDPLAQVLREVETRCTRIGKPLVGGELTFAWWNTGISSSGGDSAVDGGALLSQIVRLCEACDVVGLGEFSDPMLLMALQELLPNNRVARQLDELEGQKVVFKTAMVYNSSRLELDESVPLIKRNLFRGNGADITNQYRIAQKARLRIAEIDGSIDFYFSHWRMHDQSLDEIENKDAAARRIQEDAFGREGELKKLAAAVLMGDFNAEPQEPHSKKLLMSRSGEFVRSYGGFFNPFWRQFHDERGTINGGNDKLRTKSCLFDYIMVSAPFVKLPNFSCTEWIGCDLTYNPPPSQHRPVAVRISWSI